MSRPTRREFLQGSLATGVLSAAYGCGTRETAREQTSRPNILFLFSDQHRWDWTPANPDVHVPMPHLEALAARGLTVERAYCAAPVCGPSRACLAFGREYDDCGVPSNRQSLPLDRETFYGLLRDAGYNVLGCGKFDLASGALFEIIEKAGQLGEPVGLGLDGRRFTDRWGFTNAVNNAGKGAGALIYLTDPVGPKDSYYAYLDGRDPAQGRVCAEDMVDRRSPQTVEQWGKTRVTPLAEDDYLDNWIGGNGMSLLDGVPSEEPWFLIVNFAGPHPPMDITRRMERLYRGPDRVIDGFPQPDRYDGPWDADHHVRIRQNYAAMIENIDRWIGLFVQRLAERGELENTIIVYSSDHGEMLGDRSRWGKQVPFEASAGVPLVIAGPGVAPGRSTSAMVSLIDLTATFLDLGGAAVPDEMDGISLRGLLAGEADRHREYVLSGLYDWRMVYDGRYKLITGFEGASRLLYDLEEDPLEKVDRSADDPRRCRELEAMMRQGSYNSA
ncbi:MAG: sulfatase-like hydrolase/transferase [Acidobacteria bacterium]|nr:sulfatase-like hydrolase/transferase [Acidobacteriota bacterium]